MTHSANANARRGLGPARGFAAVALAVLVAGCAALGERSGAPVLASEARAAGIIAIAGPVRGTVRILYARNGGMVLLREIRLPEGAAVQELALSADGGDLFIGTTGAGYAFSTRTGRMEAWTQLASAGGAAGTV